jgi:WD40 repeat protein
VAGRRLVRVLDGGDGGLSWVAFSPDGALLATAGNSLTGRLWDTAKGTGPVASQWRPGPCGSGPG